MNKLILKLLLIPALLVTISWNMIHIYALADEGTMNTKIVKSEEQWKKELTQEKYKILRNKETETPFTGKYYTNKKKGIYYCAGCGTPLFSSNNKYDSGSGWPSFYDAITPNNVQTDKDTAHNMVRTEILCQKCGGHLGHVFNDGPEPTGLRYCVNSGALDFKPDISADKTRHKPELATFAAGCFWHVEDTFSKINGVLKTTAGYTGGTEKNPDYKKVCTGNTGHAESIQIEYNPEKISYEELLKKFWDMHDPTTANRQGPDLGTQYRSVIFYHNESQKNTAIHSKNELQKSGKYKNNIITEIMPAGTFFPAEEYHQKYYQKHSINSCGIK